MQSLSRIERDPEICGGQPTIRGTRVLVLDILSFLKEGKSFDEIVQSFPSITHEDIRAIIEYAQAVIEGERVKFVKP